MQAVSNIQSLAKVLPFLTVLEELPTTVVGIIQGIFPAIALAILVALVPIIFRCKLSMFGTCEILTYYDLVLSVQEGIPQNSMVDLSLLHKYFFFLVSYLRLFSHLDDTYFIIVCRCGACFNHCWWCHQYLCRYQGESS